ncbi:MAG: sugar phosphate isomerase [Planctomycetaceae bacterium]|nr:sugar phosphate isomerase [Planctomycetaceae bacterium]
MAWCFKPMPALELAKHVKAIGMPAIEGLPADQIPVVKELGLDISLVGSHSFKRGMVHTENHDYAIKALTKSIDIAAENGFKSVITFTGLVEKEIDRDQGTKNCVAGWKKIIGYAEKKKINLVFEHLNTRDDTHPMKGHPGYFGDDVDHCVDMIKQVGSPNFKLLFDVYHVQIMNGDVIRRIKAYKEYIGHYHTAGNPGRAELDDTQEINYPPIMKTILETGYTGYVAHEFIPTWEDKIAALRQAVHVCDV